MQKNKLLGIIIVLIGVILLLIHITLKISDKIIINNKINSYCDSKNKQKDIYGILEIPDLDINNIIYNYSSPQNNVNKNVYLVKESNSLQIIVAAHSGESIKSYFKNLNLLNSNDLILFTKNNIIREYKLFKKEEAIKDGSVPIKKYNYPTIVLITCSKTDKTKQELYYARLTKSYKKSKNY